MPVDSENASVVTFIDNYTTRNNNNATTTAQWKDDAFSVTSLVHPSTGKEQHFIISNNNNTIYELQSIARNYGSFFVGSRVISNGALHVMTRVDPLFFVLQQLTTTSKQNVQSQWQPLDQLEVSQVVQDCISDATQWKHVCAVKTLGDDDLVLYKFQESVALEWLVKKQQATMKVVKQQLLHEKRSQRRATKLLMSQGGGAFSNSFRLAEDDDENVEQQNNESSSNDGENNSTTTSTNTTTELTNMELAAAKEASVEIVGEYLSFEWQTKLRERLNMTTASTTVETTENNDSTTNSSSNVDGKKRRASWEANPGQDDADQLLQFTMGDCGSTREDADSNKKKEPAKTAGLKRLAKVNTKGMKSLSSFFGAKKKKD